MATRCGPSLNNFFVFNPSYGRKEGQEHKKILYYHPDKTEEGLKLRNVGLSEALINFTETFDPEKPCEIVHTQKNRQLFLQPEKNFWMVMTINLQTEQNTTDGRTCLENVQDYVYEAVLRTTYRMFRLFSGSFSSLVSKNGGNTTMLKSCLKQFFEQYLQQLRLQHADLLDVFQGIHFLPLDKHGFLKVQCFVNHLEAKFSEIKYSVFLCNDQLVWSGLDQNDMQVLYKYLTGNVLQGIVESELLPASVSPNKHSPTSHHARFLSGSTDDESSLSRIQLVFVNAEAEEEECHLLIFRALSATLCMLVSSTYPLTLAFLKKLENYLAPQLTALASDISEQYSKLASLSISDHQCKYIYFNRMNMAQKSSIHADRRSGIVIPKEIVKLLADISCDLYRLTDCGEVIAKTTCDWWVVGKLSDQREFYVVINQKSANIIQIHDEVKKLCATQFQNIFFLE